MRFRTPLIAPSSPNLHTSFTQDGDGGAILPPMATLVVIAALVLAVPALLVIGGLRSRRFDPRPEMARLRGTMAAAVAAPCLVLIYSLTTTWYISYEREPLRLGDGRDGVVQFTVLTSLAAGVAIVGALYGFRNWSALPLLLSWVSLAGAWFLGAVHMQMGAGPPPPEVKEGLPVATVAITALTVLACAGAAVREHDGY